MCSGRGTARSPERHGILASNVNGPAAKGYVCSSSQPGSSPPLQSVTEQLLILVGLGAWKIPQGGRGVV